MVSARVAQLLAGQIEAHSSSWFLGTAAKEQPERIGTNGAKLGDTESQKQNARSSRPSMCPLPRDNDLMLALEKQYLIHKTTGSTGDFRGS